MKRIIMTLILAVSVNCRLDAQALFDREVALEYTTELQSDFVKGVNWMNLMQIRFSIQLAKTKPFWFEMSTIGTFNACKESLIEDLQGFSNIESETLPFAFAVFGLHWSSGGRNSTSGLNTELFAGVRNVNEDYFTTTCTSLFTGSSCGISPTVSAGVCIANYPHSAFGINFKQHFQHWTIDASIYNGCGYNGFSYKDNPFRICPREDGVFVMSSINCNNGGSHYNIGGAYHSIQPCAAIWAYIEQRLTDNLHLLASASVNFAHAAECKHYGNIGLVASIRNMEAGLVMGHAYFVHANEYSGELTLKIPVHRTTCLQPAFHFIRTGAENHCIGLLRLVFEIGNS